MGPAEDDDADALSDLAAARTASSFGSGARDELLVAVFLLRPLLLRSTRARGAGPEDDRPLLGGGVGSCIAGEKITAVRTYLVTTMVAAVSHLRCFLFDSQGGPPRFCVTTVSCHCGACLAAPSPSLLSCADDTTTTNGSGGPSLARWPSTSPLLQLVSSLVSTVCVLRCFVSVGFRLFSRAPLHRPNKIWVYAPLQRRHLIARAGGGLKKTSLAPNRKQKIKIRGTSVRRGRTKNNEHDHVTTIHPVGPPGGPLRADRPAAGGLSPNRVPIESQR